MPSLHADVFPVKPLLTVPFIPLPDDQPPVWTPSTVTLIHSEHEAVLVDPLTTIAQAQELADWISATIPKKTLKYIFVTHGHGDHFFGLPVLLEKFPTAVAIATRATHEHAKGQVDERSWGFWTYMYPDGQIAGQDLDNWKILDEKDPVFHLDGDRHELRAVSVGHSDTDDTSVLWVPELRLVVAGDVVYNSAFQWLVESPTAELREKWISAVDKVKALNPTSVVTGHKRTGAIDGAWTLDWTQHYLRTWNEIADEVKKEGGKGREMFAKMKQRFPDNEGDLVLWYSSLAQFGELPGF